MDRTDREEKVLRTIQQSVQPVKPMEVVRQISGNSYTKEAKLTSAAIRSLVERGDVDVTVDLKLQVKPQTTQP